MNSTDDRYVGPQDEQFAAAFQLSRDEIEDAFDKQR